MRRLFQGFLVMFGVIAIGISLAHLAVGSEAIIGGSPVNPTSDGEDRFYAGLFGCYGVALLWCARGVERKQVYVNVLAAVLLAGGIGRLVALIARGPAGPVFRRDAGPRASPAAVDGAGREARRSAGRSR